MSSSPPAITIGLSVFNAGPYLRDCLRSIYAQTVINWELIAVDGGSDDESAGILRSIRDPRVRVLIAGEHRHRSACLSQIVALARSPYIARMDADDLMDPQRLEKQLQFLDSHPEVDVVGCGMAILGADDQPIGLRMLPQNHDQICSRPLNGVRLAHATVLTRTAWLRKFPYNEQNSDWEDWELWFTSYRQSCFANLAEPLYFYRQCASMTLARHLARKRGFARIVWRVGRQTRGPLAAGYESLRQWASLPVYWIAGMTGAVTTLLWRRDQPVPPVVAGHIREALKSIRGVELPLDSAAISASPVARG